MDRLTVYIIAILVFLIVFGPIFLHTWANAFKDDLYSPEIKIASHVSKRKKIIVFILFVGLIIFIIADLVLYYIN